MLHNLYADENAANVMGFNCKHVMTTIMQLMTWKEFENPVQISINKPRTQ